MSTAKTKESKATKKPVKEQKEKKQGFFAKLKSARTIGRNSGWNDSKKLPKVKGAKTMAQIGYRDGQKDHKTSEKIEKRYKKQ